MNERIQKLYSSRKASVQKHLLCIHSLWCILVWSLVHSALVFRWTPLMPATPPWTRVCTTWNCQSTPLKTSWGNASWPPPWKRASTSTEHARPWSRPLQPSLSPSPILPFNTWLTWLPLLVKPVVFCRRKQEKKKRRKKNEKALLSDDIYCSPTKPGLPLPSLPYDPRWRRKRKKKKKTHQE